MTTTLATLEEPPSEYRSSLQNENLAPLAYDARRASLPVSKARAVVSHRGIGILFASFAHLSMEGLLRCSSAALLIGFKLLPHPVRNWCRAVVD